MPPNDLRLSRCGVEGCGVCRSVSNFCIRRILQLRAALTLLLRLHYHAALRSGRFFFLFRTRAKSQQASLFLIHDKRPEQSSALATMHNDLPLSRCGVEGCGVCRSLLLRPTARPSTAGGTCVFTAIELSRRPAFRMLFSIVFFAALRRKVDAYRSHHIPLKHLARAALQLGRVTGALAQQIGDLAVREGHPAFGQALAQQG